MTNPGNQLYRRTFVSSPYTVTARCYFAPGIYKYCDDRVLSEGWGAGVVTCLEQGADLHMAQLMPLPLTVSCFSEIQTGFTFVVPAYPGSPGQRAVKRVCVCLSVCLSVREHISGTTRPILNKFFMHVTYTRGSHFLWRRCDMLCISDFMDII